MTYWDIDEGADVLYRKLHEGFELLGKGLLS